MDTQEKTLTPRQTEVVKHVCSGLKNEEIGKIMKITTQTVEVHRYNAMRVLGVTNVVQLMQTALERNIVKFTKKSGFRVLVLGAVLCSSVAWAGEFTQDGSKLTIILDTAGQHHTTPKGAKVLDTIHGTLPDGSRFQARVYRPAVKVKPCTTDTDCEEKNPGIK